MTLTEEKYPINVPPAVADVFKAVDSKDASGFVSHLTPDGVFRYANAPPVTGHDAVRQAVAQFFDAVASLRHEILQTWVQGEMVFVKGEVNYVRHDGSKAGPFPFFNLFAMRDGKIAQYLIYVDISPLWQRT
jgi:ketosteroid isomerase-like protein